MNASDLIRFQIDDLGYQLEKCLEGWSPDHRDDCLVEGCLSASQTLAHLCECYVAFAKETRGEKHEWGSYSIPDPAWDAALAEFRALRAEAANLACVDDEKHLKLGSAYIVGHDAYHVGTLCQLRLKFEPEWNAFSIYR